MSYLRPLLLLCLFQTAKSLFETVGCFWSARGLIPLLFDSMNYDYYDTVFRADSVLAFAQAGEYVGPEDIAEYITSVDSNVSPFLAFGAKVSSLCK